MPCLIVGRGRKLNELNMEIKSKYDSCTFISIHEDEGPDEVVKFEDFTGEEKFDCIFFDLYVEEFLIYTGSSSRAKGLGSEKNNKLVREAIIRNLKKDGTVYFPASINVEKKFPLQLSRSKGYSSVSGGLFKIKRPRGVYPLFKENQEKRKLLANFYYTMTFKK
jgi:hypothetical protein